MRMLGFISALLTLWLFAKAVGLFLKMTWGAAKIVATVLLALAMPVLVLCLLFASGILLLVPVAVTASAFILVKIFT